MLCKNCGEQIPDEATICPKCGNKKDNKRILTGIKNHLIGALLLSVLFCFPFVPITGFIATAYAVQVNPLLAAGDTLGARRASEVAKGWIISGLVIAGIYLVFIVIAVFSSVIMGIIPALLSAK